MFVGALGCALALGLYLQWPSLTGGFRGDDYVQRAMLRGEFPAARSELDLFSFAAGTPRDHQQLADFGFLPWWAHPELRLRMWRPLASELIALDHRLFDRRAELHHAHSLAWFALLQFATALVLWRFLPPSAAAVGLLVFAIAPCHTLPVGWLANRSTLVGAALAFFALALFARGTAGIQRTLGIIVLTSLALLCGEYTLSALAYAVLFGLSSTPGSLRSQLKATAPILGPIAAYLALHSLVGSDIVHSGYYLSPLRASGDFALAALQRVPVLAADLLFGLPSYQYNTGSPWRDRLLESHLIAPELWQRLPGWQTWHTLIGYLALLYGVVLWRALRQLPENERMPGWFAAAAALSLVPSAGSLPEDRLLVATTLGASALIASVLTQLPRLFRQARTLRSRIGYSVLWLAALWVPVSACMRSYDDVRGLVEGSEVARAFALDADLPGKGAADTRVYVVAAADFGTAVNLPWVRRTEGDHPLPFSYRRLSPGPMPLVITRVADRVLELNVVTSDVFGTAVPSLYRDAGSPVRSGERRIVPGLAVDVIDVIDDNPARMRFTFDRSLDDPQLWFVVASEQGLRHTPMPALGESLRLPFAQFIDVRTVTRPAH